MIRATSITFNDDGTAWLSVQRNSPNPLDDAIWWTMKADRPCDTCGDTRVVPQNHPIAARCPDCINGRHTFPLDVIAESEDDLSGAVDQIFLPGSHDPAYRLTLRVSVVPGMILPIVAKDIRGEAPDRYVYVLDDGRAWLVDGDSETPITLGSDAKPGGFAVLLRVAS